jgi:hypothetical protein
MAELDRKGMLVTSLRFATGRHGIPSLRTVISPEVMAQATKSGPRAEGPRQSGYGQKTRCRSRSAQRLLVCREGILSGLARRIPCFR